MLTKQEGVSNVLPRPRALLLNWRDQVSVWTSSTVTGTRSGDPTTASLALANSSCSRDRDVCLGSDINAWGLTINPALVWAFWGSQSGGEPQVGPGPGSLPVLQNTSNFNLDWRATAPCCYPWGTMPSFLFYFSSKRIHLEEQHIAGSLL